MGRLHAPQISSHLFYYSEAFARLFVLRITSGIRKAMEKNSVIVKRLDSVCKVWANENAWPTEG